MNKRTMGSGASKSLAKYPPAVSQGKNGAKVKTHNSSHSQPNHTNPGMNQPGISVHTCGEYQLKNGTYVIAGVGDITRQRVDAIVNSVNTHLVHGGGVAYAISEAAGHSFNAECRLYIHSHRELEVSGIFTAKGGNLPAKYVINAAGPKYRDRQYNELLEACFDNILAECCKRRFTSCVIPAISTGIYGVPVEECAEAMVAALKKFSKHTTASLQYIVFIDISRSSITRIAQIFDKYLKKVHPSPSFGSVTPSAPPRPHSVQKAKASASLQSSNNNSMVRTTQLQSSNNNSMVRTTQLQSSNNNSMVRTTQQNGDIENCPICLDTPENPEITSCCKQKFCKGCLNEHFRTSGKCPACMKLLRAVRGNQPKGTMAYKVLYDALPGYEKYKAIEIHYRFPDGIQENNHPSPGHPYTGTERVAYLPDNIEGREVLNLLQKAFDNDLLFTVGTSVTTGRDNCVVWNDVHQKTSMDGGPTNYGYPDPSYMSRVKQELAAKGIQ